MYLGCPYIWKGLVPDLPQLAVFGLPKATLERRFCLNLRFSLQGRHIDLPNEFPNAVVLASQKTRQRGSQAASNLPPCREAASPSQAFAPSNLHEQAYPERG